MRVFGGCMLLLTLLLLICQVAISRICKSLINMVDGFQTLFILMHMALSLFCSPGSPPHGACSSSSAVTPTSPSPPPIASAPRELSVKSLQRPCIQTAPRGPSIPSSNPTPPLKTNLGRLCSSIAHLFFPESSYLSDPRCGLSYTHMRIQTVGALVSALLLASLCVSICLDILTHIFQPYPVQYPLLAVAVGAVSLLHNLLVLGLSWGQQLERRTATDGEIDARHHLEVNGKVSDEEPTKTCADRSFAADEDGEVSSPSNGSFHNATLVFCNPGASVVLDPDCDSQLKTRKSPPTGVHLHTAHPQVFHSGVRYTFGADSDGLPLGGQSCEAPNSTADTKAESCAGCLQNNFTETSKGGMCVELLDNQNLPKTAQVFRSDRRTDGSVPSARWSNCLPSFRLALQAPLISILTVANGLALRLAGPHCQHHSWACSLTTYLDPVLSLVAVVVLLAVALPQVYKYGLLLSQATPPHVCVSDLGQRIASVPGVRAVHDLHIWQLTDTCMVASVHVLCLAGFQTQRCGELLSDVTEVLQSVGVSCCTVQPEFVTPVTASCSGSLDNNAGNPDLALGEASAPPPLATCSLACGTACVAKMCCYAEVEAGGQPATSSAGETKEEPRVLVIENTSADLRLETATCDAGKRTNELPSGHVSRGMHLC